jgi:hypothetical protein
MGSAIIGADFAGSVGAGSAGARATSGVGVGSGAEAVMGWLAVAGAGADVKSAASTYPVRSPSRVSRKVTLTQSPSRETSDLGHDDEKHDRGNTLGNDLERAATVRAQQEKSRTVRAAAIRIYPDPARSPLATLPEGTSVQALNWRCTWTSTVHLRTNSPSRRPPCRVRRSAVLVVRRSKEHSLKGVPALFVHSRALDAVSESRRVKV